MKELLSRIFNELGLEIRQSINNFKQVLQDQIYGDKYNIHFDKLFKECSSKEEILSRITSIEEIEIIIIRVDEDFLVFNEFEMSKIVIKQIYLFFDGQKYWSLRCKGDHSPIETNFYRKNTDYFENLKNIEIIHLLEEVPSNLRDMTNFYSKFIELILKDRCLNFSFREIISDGNCLFRAISDQLFSDQNEHSVLRRNVCQHIRRERLFYEEFLLNNDQLVDNFEDFVTKLETIGEWAGDESLKALADMLRVNIIVHSIKNDIHIFSSTDTPRCLNIYYNGYHYSSLIPVIDRNSENDNITN